jgi:CheY-like chemotaxis protein
VARIVVIDDSAGNRQLFDYLLRHFGHETVLAADGAEGIEAVLRERPDLVIIDLVMPGMRGEEVATRLRGMPEVARIPLLAVSVALDPAQLPEGGFDGWYPLPVDPKALLEGVEAHLQHTATG